jgi:hypothetical protein
MRKIVLEDVEVEREEVRRELDIKEDKRARGNQTAYQPMQYQQPQHNPFQSDPKYEFMLIAMNPFVALLYQIVKLFMRR